MPSHIQREINKIIELLSQNPDQSRRGTATDAYLADSSQSGAGIVW
jgi:hypothetical protein